MNSLSIIHSIENKFENKFERQARLYLESFRHIDPHGFSNTNIYFHQPTDYDILETTQEYFYSLGVNFEKHLMVDTSVARSNKCYTATYLQPKISTSHLCFLDLDVVILNPFKDLNKLCHNLFMVCCENLASNYTVNKTYDTLYRHYIDPKWRVPYIKRYVNTCLVMGPSSSRFWLEWPELTRHLHMIRKQHDRFDDRYDYEILEDEIALAILYSLYTEQFGNIADFYPNFIAVTNTNDSRYDLKPNTCIFHYEGILHSNNIELQGSDPLHLAVQGDNYKKEISHMLIMAAKRGFINNSTMLTLTKIIQNV